MLMSSAFPDNYASNIADNNFVKCNNKKAGAEAPAMDPIYNDFITTVRILPIR